MTKYCKYHCDYGDGENCHYKGEGNCMFNRGTRSMPDREKVMSWLEGLAEPDWRDFHSDSEVQNIAKFALAMLKEQETELCDRCGRRRLKSSKEGR